MKIGFIVILMLLCLLTSCGRREGYSDLKNYVDQLKKNYASTAKKNDSTPKYKLILAEYQKGVVRTPFDEGNSSQGKSAANPLSGYPVNMLRFVGTVTDGGNVWAYISTPDSKVYKIKEGDIVGDHDGKVMKINSKQIEILEQPIGDEKQDAQRIITLQLKEEG